MFTKIRAELLLQQVGSQSTVNVAGVCQDVANFHPDDISCVLLPCAARASLRSQSKAICNYLFRREGRRALKDLFGASRPLDFYVAARGILDDLNTNFSLGLIFVDVSQAKATVEGGPGTAFAFQEFVPRCQLWEADPYFCPVFTPERTLAGHGFVCACGVYSHQPWFLRLPGREETPLACRLRQALPLDLLVVGNVDESWEYFSAIIAMHVALSTIFSELNINNFAKRLSTTGPEESLLRVLLGINQSLCSFLVSRDQ